eukprot:8465478-Prorocentrum_lima.AAC.1
MSTSGLARQVALGPKQDEHIGSARAHDPLKRCGKERQTPKPLARNKSRGTTRHRFATYIKFSPRPPKER